ncbi:MAG: BACON domain-containing protein [Bacteroidales bacterium]|nr:BACON domain-containing protein [Bacteroidales bacterium]
MKKTAILLCCAAALVTGLAGCGQKAEEPDKVVDLRYRAEDTYDLPASGAKAFTVLVASTDPWTITSEHPDWCIISDEEGAASDPAAVHEGKAEATTIRIQYYDNTFLDDRVDKITIRSDYWVGKVITVRQKGSAFLTVSEDDLEQDVTKAGGDHFIHIKSNQDWSARVTGGDWVTVTEGATGNGTGTVTVNAAENSAELRYAEVTVYDRLNEPQALIKFTQDGVQLVPLSTEIRAGFDQASAELDVLSNSKWQVVKESAADDWFDIVTPQGEGDGTIRLSFRQNDGEGLRSATILLSNVVAHEGDFGVVKEIVVKQAYEITPVRVAMNADELSLWTSDWANKPVVLKDVGLQFDSKARLNRSMPFGNYTFRWSAIGAGARVRHWFCFSEGCELKADIRPADGKIGYDFNAAGDGNKPSLSGYTDVDFSQPVEITYKFDPSGANYCHVTYYVNGVEAGSFDTAADMLRTVTWGASVNMYIGVQDEGSAICEWYEYTAPMNWDE